MVLQSQQVVVYRMVDDAGREYALSRFILPKDVLIALNDGRFPQCLKELMSITHGCLRPVIDGGLDPVDRSPWLATYWWDGKSLEERTRDRDFTLEDMQRLEEHARSVISGVGQFASFLSFDPAKIVLVKGAANNWVETFSVDLYQWFLSWATGRPPSPEKEPNRQLAVLISDVRKTVASPSVTSSTSPMLPPPKTTSLAGLPPMGTIALPTASSAIVGAAPLTIGKIRTAPRTTAALTSSAAKSQLAAYKKKPSKAQNRAAAFAVIFVIAAVSGLGWFIVQENQKKQALLRAKDQPIEPLAAQTADTAGMTVMERMRRELEEEERAKAQVPGQTKDTFLGVKPVRVQVVVQGEGDEIYPAPNLLKEAVESGGERPSLKEMIDLDAGEEVSLTDHQGRWVILTGELAKVGESLVFSGPSSLEVFAVAGTDELEAGQGDLVELIGRISEIEDRPVIIMERSSDLEILKQARKTSGSRVLDLEEQNELQQMVQRDPGLNGLDPAKERARLFRREASLTLLRASQSHPEDWKG